MFLREPGGSRRLGLAGGSIEIPIAIGTLVAIFFGIYPGRLMSVMQAAAVPMLTTTSGGFAAMISAPSGTGYAPLPPAKASAPASPKSTRLDPEQAKKYAARMKKARSPSQGVGAAGSAAQECPASAAQECPGKEGGSSTEGSMSLSSSISPRFHPAARFSVKRETRRPWRSSTPFRSAWTVLT